MFRQRLLAYWMQSSKVIRTCRTHLKLAANCVNSKAYTPSAISKFSKARQGDKRCGRKQLAEKRLPSRTGRFKTGSTTTLFTREHLSTRSSCDTNFSHIGEELRRRVKILVPAMIPHAQSFASYPTQQKAIEPTVAC